MNLKGLEFIDGKMGGNMKGNGKMVRCMEMEYLYGKIKVLTWVVIKMIKKKVKVHLHGAMEYSLRGIGRMENLKEIQY